MKKALIIALILCSFHTGSHGQKLHLGVNLSPSWNLNSHRTNATAWYAEHGYGFTGGFALRYEKTEMISFQSGLDYEYISFDNWANNILVSATRLGALNLPLMLNYKLNFFENWYLGFGGGINYLIQSNVLAGGSKIDVSGSIDEFQPYAALGMNTMMERNTGWFELGLQGRYRFMELWSPNQANSHGYSSHLISVDLLLRFYL